MSSQLPDQVALWDLQPDQWLEWIAAGLGTIDYQTYRQRIVAAAATLREQGLPVVLVHASVEEVLRRLDQLGLGRGPAAVAAVIAMLGVEQSVGGGTS